MILCKNVERDDFCGIKNPEKYVFTVEVRKNRVLAGTPRRLGATYPFLMFLSINF
jgi:hypothetical protein